MCFDTDSEFEADPIENGDLFQTSLTTKNKDDKKTQDNKTEKGKKDSKATKPADSKSAKNWTDDEISLLIHLLESNPCLWDIHHKDYNKHMT